MNEKYYIGVYWGIRKETAQECSRRITLLLRCLSQCDSLFSNWFKLGTSRKDTLMHRIELGEDSILSIVLDGRNRTDFDRNVIAELGFRIGLWTGGDDEGSAGFSIGCGCYSPAVGLNSCLIDLPSEGENATRILQASTLVRMMECIVSIWEPDWGVVTSRSYRDIARKQPDGMQLVGWLTYLKQTQDKLPSLPLSAHVIPYGSQGLFVIATDEKFTVDNETQVAVIEDLTEILYQAKLLQPFK